MDAFQRELIELLPRLRRTARALCRQRADADDLVQVAVERALARRSQWTPGTRLDFWVMRIMKNAWIDEGRATSRKLAILRPAEEGLSAADPTAPDPATALDKMALDDAMAELPEDQRLAVVLVLVEGLSYAEAAEVLQVPAGTLTSRLGRGRATLIERMELHGMSA